MSVGLHREAVCMLPVSPPSSLLFSFPRWLPPPSLHVGSSLRLHFSCMGSLLSSPANKSSANLLPESLCPCSDCSNPPLLGNTGRRRGWEPEWEREREWERGGEGELGGSATKWPSAVQKQQASLSLSVFQRSGAFHPPQVSRTVHYCEAGEDTYKRRRTRKKWFNRPLLCVRTSCLRVDCWKL